MLWEIVFIGGFIIGMFSGWMIAPYIDKIIEWRKKRIKKE